MKELNQHFFQFCGYSANHLPEVKDLHTYEKGILLEVPKIELAGIRKEWPACIPPFYSHDPIFMKKDVIDIIQQEGLTGLLTKPVEVFKLNGKSKFDRDIPQYHLVEAAGKMTTGLEVYEDVDRHSDNGRRYKFLFFAENFDDPRIKEINDMKDYGRHVYRHIPNEDQWDGLDFFDINQAKRFGAIFCSLKFVELALKYQWGNIYFEPLDTLPNSGGEFKKRPWPPKLWYPELQKKLYD